MTAGECPDNDWAWHDCGYAPLLTGGRLVKKHDPAWQMYELRGRDYFCLTERVRFRACKGPDHKWPGYLLGGFHSQRSHREYPGYPDYDLWGPAGAMHRELKRMGEKPTPAQVATLTQMWAAGRDVGVWWTCCWYSGRIDRELAAIAGVPPMGRHGDPRLPPQLGEAGYLRPSVPPPAPPAPRRAAAGPCSSAVSPAGGVPAGWARRTEQVSTLTPAEPRPALRLPGAPAERPEAITGAVAYEVPLGHAAQVPLENWLRAHGFAQVLVPTPIGLIVGGDRFAVRCRDYTSRDAPRLWRSAAIQVPIPPDLAAWLNRCAAPSLPI